MKTENKKIKKQCIKKTTPLGLMNPEYNHIALPKDNNNLYIQENQFKLLSD